MMFQPWIQSGHFYFLLLYQYKVGNVFSTSKITTVHIENTFHSVAFVTGDYLSFERGKEVLHTQSDAKTPTDRLEGILMGMADFHVQMNFLKMIYKMLFKVEDHLSSVIVSNNTTRNSDCNILLKSEIQAQRHL